PATSEPRQGRAGGGGGRGNRPTAYTCSQDSSARDVGGFSQLKPHLQDFLLYRHCRRFRLLQDAPGKCGRAPEDSAGVFLLVAIKTSPGSFDRRAVLRRTWAAEQRQNGAGVRRVFLAGTADRPGAERRWRTDELLRLENRRHGDILQWDFLESFFNLTLKQLLFLDWVRERCPRARYVFLGDDDVFANTDNMVRYLQARDAPGTPPHLYVGQVLRETKPVRWAGSKYYIPTQVYAAKTFPPYCTGGGFLMSGYTAWVVHNMSSAVPVMPIDDAYIGMCLEKAGLPPTDHFGFLAVGENAKPNLIYAMDPCLSRDLFLVHSFQTYEILVMWERIHSPDLKCAIPDQF
ncbi:acetylgalactosaminyl-O-glycosyl-glycoprotein beta-1,3-N-acetylglucosaminyltransferase-like, partial [Anguilla rostrata]|uniref:acetylgalactosaminyl-O-glycosyl-glycoprotein beta-1,3-N-acetylglucosaminyltransferase-like n=1 Tax=Anguilla rostrata TaxID=7938 RepID=UPI0030CE2A26